MPADFRRDSHEMDEVATSLAAFICRVGAEQSLDDVRVGWRWTGHIWVPSHAGIQVVTGVRTTDWPERSR
jgi:hypothetical protein